MFEKRAGAWHAQNRSRMNARNQGHVFPLGPPHPVRTVVVAA
jgi:hypothetical protein